MGCEQLNLIVSFLSTPSARRATFSGVFYRRYILGISIHALREEGDCGLAYGTLSDPQFLSTPSARRATATTGSSLSRIGHFYPRPPRGGRPSSALCSCCHALFLSTPSARRATARRYAHGLGSAISIHALREEGDDAQSGGKDMGFISIHALREEGDS